MALRWLAFAGVFFGLSPQAFAAEPSSVFQRASCTLVRYYVAKYSEQAAEQWARSKGASEADIEAARRCLKATPVQTAQRATD